MCELTEALEKNREAATKAIDLADRLDQSLCLTCGPHALRLQLLSKRFRGVLEAMPLPSAPAGIRHRS